MQFYKERLLSPGQLKRLSEHKYSCTSNSLLDGLLQPWWDWLVSKVPLWLAPNLITVLGLIVNIATTLILVYYSPDARAEAPRWACFLCALGLFIYQSLDAIDGKQARRTGTSTPLGELFDHGCDSISTVFVALSACIAVQLGYYPTWMFFQCFCAMTLFYCAHWQTYVSGSLRFGKVDVTEAQFTIIAIHLISAIFGPQIWMLEVVLFLIISVLTWQKYLMLQLIEHVLYHFFNFLHGYNLTNGKYCILLLCLFLLKHNHRLFSLLSQGICNYTHVVAAYITQSDSVFMQIAYIDIIQR